MEMTLLDRRTNTISPLLRNLIIRLGEDIAKLKLLRFDSVQADKFDTAVLEAQLQQTYRDVTDEIQNLIAEINSTNEPKNNVTSQAFNGIDTGKVLVETIGYEGQTISEFIRLLCSREVEAVLDVRADPVSRKPGFSKAALEQRLSEVGIKYFAFPKLGIPAFYRRQYPNRNELLDFYERELLPNVSDEIERAKKVCQEYRAVLLCYEADPMQCHRSRLLTWIERAV